MLRSIYHRVLSVLGLAKKHSHIAGPHRLRHPGETTPRREVPYLPEGRTSAPEDTRPPRRNPRNDKPRPARDAAPADAARPPREERAPRQERAARPPRRENEGGEERRRAPRRDEERGHQGRRNDRPRPVREDDGECGESALPIVPKRVGEAWDPASFPVEVEEGKTRFQDLGLNNDLLHALAELGFRYCTPIQAVALPHTLKGANVAGKAQTGTGKTAAFLLAVFQKFVDQPDKAPRGGGTPRALVLAPTRELVVQIQKDADLLGRFSPVRCVAVYGGMGYDQQERQLGAGVDILAATPGRLIDFIRKGTVNLDKVEVLIIDEADRMLDMGFIPDVRRIIARTPRNDQRQTLLFSATLSSEIMRLASQWMDNPVILETEAEHVAAQNVEQIVYLCTSREKLPLLVNLLQQPEFSRVLVFSNRRDATARVCDRLRAVGISCDMLSGDVPQNKRMRILEEFRDGKLRVLAATDVAGRGLHIKDVSHVINYDVPPEPEDYVHRIGRTGRAGASGNAITFACERESFSLPEIEALLGESLTYRQPTDEQLRSGGPRRPPRSESPAPTPAAAEVANEAEMVSEEPIPQS